MGQVKAACSRLKQKLLADTTTTTNITTTYNAGTTTAMGQAIIEAATLSINTAPQLLDTILPIGIAAGKQPRQ